jgi:Protein of unknown function (DUF3237)
MLVIRAVCAIVTDALGAQQAARHGRRPRPGWTMLKFEPLCKIEAQVGPIVSLGRAQYGERRVIAILGGSVTGARMNGAILPGGADWQINREDGVLDIEARYVIRLSDGAGVEVLSQGYRHGAPEVMARLARGEPVSPDEYFFRTVIRFQTGAAAHADLNRTLAIASAVREPGLVKLDVFRLL